MADGRGKSVDGDFLAGGGGAVDAVDDLLDGETGFTGGAERRAFEDAVGEVLQFRDEEGVAAGAREVTGLGVDHRAGVVGEEGGRVEIEAALRAHDREVPDVMVDVGGEGGFDLHDAAVVETDLSDGEIFDGEGLPIPTGPHAFDFGRLVANVRPDVAGRGDRARFADAVVGGFEAWHLTNMMSPMSPAALARVNISQTG